MPGNQRLLGKATSETAWAPSPGSCGQGRPLRGLRGRDYFEGTGDQRGNRDLKMDTGPGKVRSPKESKASMDVYCMHTEQAKHEDVSAIRATTNYS